MAMKAGVLFVLKERKSFKKIKGVLAASKLLLSWPGQFSLSCV